VLGANDGIVSTASLIVGVAAARASRSDIMVAGVAGLVAGALSMAAGEYVSVTRRPTLSVRTLLASALSWTLTRQEKKTSWPVSMSSVVSNPRWPESSPSS
jgi:VIT1/CCC1 family predicted Fe2+/Mn2+ transporter